MDIKNCTDELLTKIEIEGMISTYRNNTKLLRKWR